MTIGVPIVTCLHRVRRIHKENDLDNYSFVDEEVGVKLTPDPINCLIFENGFDLYRRDVAAFTIYVLPSIWHT